MRHEKLTVAELVTKGLTMVDATGTDETMAVVDATITVGAAAAESCTVTVQLLNSRGENIAYAANVYAYFSDVSTGLTFAATGPDTVTIGASGALLAVVAKKLYLLQTSATGSVAFAVGENLSLGTFYLGVIMPVTGKAVVSGGIQPTGVTTSTTAAPTTTT